MELKMNSQQDSEIAHPTLSDPNTNIVIEVSPNTLLDSNRFVCHVCNKGFSREQNLALHRRVHNLPFHLKTRTRKGSTPRKVYICPEPTCIHHNHSQALGDFGGLKKHYLRKHGIEKKHKCNNCSKAYAVESDFRAHSKICIVRKYNCECGIRFSSHSKFMDHLEYCDAPEQEDATKAPQNSENSVRNTSNNFIGSTTYLPMSQLCDFKTDNAAIFTPQQNQHEFQVKDGIGCYTNLMMNIENNRMSHEGEGSNLFSGTCMMFNNSISLNSTSGVPNATFGQQLSAPEPGSTSRNNITCNGVGGFMIPFGNTEFVQGYASSLSGGFIMPPEHNVLFGSDHFNLADKSGIQNPFLNQGNNYYGYGDHALEGAIAQTTDEVAPSGDQYYRNEHGFWF